MAFRSSSHTGSGNDVQAALPVPTGAASGDIAVVSIYLQSAATVTPPTGFTLKADIDVGSHHALTYWKRLTAADTGSYTFTWSGSAYREGVCALFSGRVASGDPFESFGTNTATSTTVTVTALSPAASGDDLVGTCTNFNGGAWTPPSGMTEREDMGIVITLDSADAVAAGSTGNKTFTCASSGDSGAFLGALLPAGGGGSNLTATPADAEGITDSAGDVQDYVRSQADAEGVTDSAAPVADRPRSQADPVGLTDAAATVAAFVRAPTDSVGLSDAAGEVQDYVRATAETVGLTDTLGVVWDRSTTIGDNLGVTDPGSTQDRADTVDDPVGITDNAAASRSGNLTANPADAVGVTDALTAVFDRVVTVADFLNLTDSAGSSQAGAGSANLNDGEGVTDTVSPLSSRDRTPADPLGLGDSAVAVLDRTRTLTEALGITDSVSAVLVGENAGVPVANPRATLTTARSRATLTTPTSRGNLT